ncbi:MAG: serine/threonine protein kinase [Gemmataceae bacterium]|nr:serine/threonine protein kinase [Gemmataceae bacterium]
MNVHSLSLRGGKELWSGYQLVRIRGQGGFGHVWEAATPGGERVALKFIRCGNNLTAAQEVRNILRVRQLQHPNLVHIHDVRCDRGYVIVSMELADGSLEDLLQVSEEECGAALPLEHVCHYLAQTARAIDFMNAPIHDTDGVRAGIQHGDVKPANMLLFGDLVKLADFGLSRVLTASVASHGRTGTMAYAAPEVFDGQISRWADQFGLAVSYFQLRTLRLPFAKLPPRFGPVQPRSEPDLALLPAPERDILTRALAKRPQDRWPSCTELLSQLARLAPPPPTSPEPTTAAGRWLQQFQA